jgi:hypothetical protein
MHGGLNKASNLFYESATTAGAMPRFFIAVGNPQQKEEMCKLLSARGFDVMKENFSAPQLWPKEFFRHEGSHFNSRLFVLGGLEPLYDRFGDEVLRRLQLERQMLERTATWTLLWIDSVSVAGRLRAVAPQLWKGADQSAVFPPLDPIDHVSWGSPTSSEVVITSFGEIAIPSRIAGIPLGELLASPPDLEARFWADLIHLRPSDALLTVSLAAKGKDPLSPELGRAVILLAAPLRMEKLQQTLRKRLGQEEFAPSGSRILRTDESRNALVAEFEAMKNDRRWVELGEAAVGLADLEAIEHGAEQALEIVNSVLEGPIGWIGLGANLLLDRPLRFRVMILRAMGMVSEAAADLDLWEKIADGSGLDPLIASSLEARALHVEDLGDLAQAERWRSKALQLKS